MTRTSLNRVLRLGVGLGVMLGMFGCAQEREPIVRVQPNALDKSFFVGDLANKTDDPQFYWRGYVVDNSATQEQIGVGSWSHVDRITWEISENMLIAHKAYPLFTQPNDPGHYSGPDSTGTVVAAYPISSHFDIRRSYNSSTGEEQNIIEENASDRPWYERQYMRVDWSTNVVNDPMWMDMFAGTAFGDIKLSPLVYNVTDPTSPNAPHFEPEDGYFDITNRFYLETANIWIWGFQAPACWIYGLFHGGTTYECDPQEATVRFSFKKIDKDTDFEPLETGTAALDIVGNPGGLGDAFSVGVVTAPRQGFDPAYGFTDKNFKRFANIHNIWKRSHQDAYCDTKYDDDANGTDDQCENGVTGYGLSSGSQCDIYKKKCTIPYRDREVKTVGYWVNDLMPAEFLDTLDGNGQPTDRGASEDIVYSWNQMMKASVANAREVECRRTGGSRDECHGAFFGDKEMVSFGNWLIDSTLDQTPVLTLCHNPVREYDIHEVCGPTGYQARTGDIRRNMLVYWPYESRAPWGGIANWNGDPLTGEIIGGMALTMGRSVRYGSAFARDVLQVAMGDTTLDEIINGTPQNTYFPGTYFKAQNSQLSADQIKSRVEAVDAKHAMETMGIKPLEGQTVAEQLSSFSTMKANARYDFASESAAVSRFDALSAPLQGTSFESNIVSPSWIRGTLGMGPNATADDQMMGMASPLRTLDTGKLRILRDTYRTRMEARGACFFENESPSIGSVAIPGLATYFKTKYADLDKVARGQAIYEELLKETYKGIELHEMGHSLGMLHQFASSWDAPNFNPQYWQLRTNEGAATTSCNGQPRDPNAPDTCMGPRYLDGETADEHGMANESRPGISYFASTSTMEYQWERFGETAGLGTYDLFAMNALYGRVLETMDDRQIPVNEQETFGTRMRSQLNEHDEIIRTSSYGGGTAFPQPVHYTELARRMKVFDPGRDCRDATDEEKAIGKWRIVHGKVCSPAPRDHAAWQDFQSGPTWSDANSSAPLWHTPKDKLGLNGAVRWFYRWGSTNNSYMHTNPSDAGADPYEVAVAVRQKFEAMYPFGYFRRHNREYAWWNVPGAVAETYFDRERSFHWHAATKTAQYMRTFGEATYNQMAQDDDYLRPYLMSGTEAFNMLYRSVVMPQPGPFYKVECDADFRAVPGWQKGEVFDTLDSAPQCQVLNKYVSQPVRFNMNIGPGRFIDDDFNSSPDGGGSWHYTEWMNRNGFQVEKAYAMALITDGRPPVYTPSREMFLDPRTQSASFYADMPHAVDRLLAGILAEDWETVGMNADISACNVKGDPTCVPVLSLYDITQKTAPARSGVAVFPNLGYDQQSEATIYAMLFARETGDMTLINKMRIWIEGVDGNIGTTGFPNPAEQVRFFNPASGLTYIARKYGPETVSGKTVDKGIGSRMLQFANILLAGTYKCEMQADKVTPVLDEYGQAKLILDGTGQPTMVNADKASTRFTALTMYVGHIDGVRQLGKYIGEGPL